MSQRVALLAAALFALSALAGAATLQNHSLTLLRVIPRAVVGSGDSAHGMV
jgi:hypothetical protein